MSPNLWLTPTSLRTPSASLPALPLPTYSLGHPSHVPFLFSLRWLIEGEQEISLVLG